MDIKDKEMVKIFKLGGLEVTIEEGRKMLIKSKSSDYYEVVKHHEIKEMQENIKCENSTLDSFLNGFIIFKRGKKDTKPGQTERLVLSINNSENLNNVLLKKLKIALFLTSGDMLDIFKAAGVMVSKGELSALFRKEGHKHYKACGDKYARKFLKGLAVKNRG